MRVTVPRRTTAAARLARLIAVLGPSAALRDHLARHPGDWRVLRDGEGLRPLEPGEVRAGLLAAVGARPEDRRGLRLPQGLVITCAGVIT